MFVQTKCNNCKEQISIWTWSEDRVRFAMEKGENFTLTCKKCNDSSKYHVNNFTAEPNKYVLLIAGIIFLIATPLIGYFIYDYLFRMAWIYAIVAVLGVLLIPVTVYGLLLRDDRNKCNSFNRTKMSEKG